MKLHEKSVIWPANLDSTKSRKAGRKLAKGSALQTPRFEELRDAATQLAIEHEAVGGKSRPNSWWEKGGYLIVPKANPRSKLLRSLATEIRKQRVTKEKDRKP